MRIIRNMTSLQKWAMKNAGYARVETAEWLELDKSSIGG
jgi:hypothetical protein